MDDAKKPAWAGIDARKGTNAPALLDERRRVLGTWELPTGKKGYAQLERAIGDSSAPVGIEGVGSFGAGVASCLAACGYEVFETIGPRREQRRRGKSDPIGAVAAAENLAAGKGLVPKGSGGAVAGVKALMTVREQISKHCAAPSGRLARWRSPRQTTFGPTGAGWTARRACARWRRPARRARSESRLSAWPSAGSPRARRWPRPNPR